MKRFQLARSVTATLVTTAMGLAVAQTQTDVHRDAATRNVGGDPFMTQYARAFYCNLPDDNNQIVVNSRGWNNTTGTGDNAQYRIPLTQIFDDVWFIGNHYVGQYLMKTPDGLVEVDAHARGNQNPHDLEVRPSLMVKVRRADVLVLNGLELDQWADVVVQGANNPKVIPGAPGRVDASAGILVLEVPTTRVDRSMGDVHPVGNPHYSLDPGLAPAVQLEAATA